MTRQEISKHSSLAYQATIPKTSQKYQLKRIPNKTQGTLDSNKSTLEILNSKILGTIETTRLTAIQHLKWKGQHPRGRKKK